MSTMPPFLSWYAPGHGGSSLRRRGLRSMPGGTWTRTASPTRISLPSRWLTGRTPRATLTPGSTDVRSLSRTTKHRAGSSSRCSVSSTAARRATGGVALVVTTSERARGPSAGARSGHRGGARRDLRRRDDDELLPGRSARPAGDGDRRQPVVGSARASGQPTFSTAFLYDHFTPFVLMQLEELGFCGRRGQGLRHGRRPVAWRSPSDEHERRAARRGRHPRNERHRRSGASDPWYLVQPGGASGARAGHGGNGSADQRRHPRSVLRSLGRVELVQPSRSSASSARRCSMSTGLDRFRRGGDGVRGAATWEGEGS